MYPGARAARVASTGEPSRCARIAAATTGGSSIGAAKPVGQSGRTFPNLVATVATATTIRANRDTANAEPPDRVR